MGHGGSFMGTQEAPDYLPDASWGLLGYLRFFHASKSSVSAMRSRMTSNMRASFPVVECGVYFRECPGDWPAVMPVNTPVGDGQFARALPARRHK